MHWMLQENLINPDTRARLERLLAERGTPYTLARLVPIFDLLDPDIEAPAGPLFLYGSTGLGNVARAKGWSGYYDENLDYRLLLEHHGSHCLNAGAVCAPLGELPHRWDRFFVRPVLDDKSFAGTVMTWEELRTFQAGVASVEDECDVTLRLSDVVAMAPLTRILAEWRFFVIAGRVITGSRYKVGDAVVSSPGAPADVEAFAQARADSWSPNEAYVLDIAATREGLKVIETNSANSAGFYACDVGALIDAVNAHLA